MRSANGISYDFLLSLFETGTNVDETAFYFTDDPTEEEHYLGYLPYGPIPEYPYWAGYCDIEDGFECATAKELFQAPIYHGKSLKERWKEANIYQIGGASIEEFSQRFGGELP